MQMKRTERISISRCEKGFITVSNFSKKPEHHVKVLPVVKVRLFFIPKRIF